MIAVPGVEVCPRCVMDRSDPNIVIGETGCSHCDRALQLLATIPTSEAEGHRRLGAVGDRIRGTGRKRSEYDAVVGLSGGVDSSYVAYLASQLGLRVLAVHFDNGWNTEVAVSNIQKICNVLDIELMTYVINWEEFRDLQRSFLLASVVDVEMVTDHAIFATMVDIAREYRIPYVLSGGNVATESIMPRAWIWAKQDLRNIRDIHRRYGSVGLESYPTMGFMEWMAVRFGPFGPSWVEFLNNVPFRRDKAIELLESKVGWRSYGQKHFESTFTKFYQACYLPQKFGVDKRKAHLSSLIMNGEVTRVEACAELARPQLPPNELETDRSFVLKKLGFDEIQFEAIMSAKPRRHDEYRSTAWLLRSLEGARSRLRLRTLRVA